MECKSLEEAKKLWPEAEMGKTALKIGDKFNRLTLVYRTTPNPSSRKPCFVFKCDCGNYTRTSGSEAKLGRTKSCGCLQKEKSSEALHKLKINKPANNREIFQYLQEVGDNGFRYIEDDRTIGKVRYCKFICPLCNQEYVGRLANVKHNLVKSCGCNIKESFGVKKIKSILIKNKIDFKTEYTFEDCKNQKVLPFDFWFYYNNEETIVEFDGSQHFYQKWSEKEFKETQLRDKIKNNYCISKGIKLYRIPYYDEDKINTLEDLLNIKYLVTPKDEEN